MSILQIICILFISVAFTIIYMIILKKIDNKMNDATIFPIEDDKVSQKKQSQNSKVKNTKKNKGDGLFGEFGEFIDEIIKDLDDVGEHTED